MLLTRPGEKFNPLFPTKEENDVNLMAWKKEKKVEVLSESFRFGNHAIFPYANNSSNDLKLRKTPPTWSVSSLATSFGLSCNKLH